MARTYRRVKKAKNGCNWVDAPTLHDVLYDNDYYVCPWSGRHDDSQENYDKSVKEYKRRLSKYHRSSGYDDYSLGRYLKDRNPKYRAYMNQHLRNYLYREDQPFFAFTKVRCPAYRGWVD